MPLKNNTLTTLQNAEKEYVKAHPRIKAKKGCKENLFMLIMWCFQEILELF